MKLSAADREKIPSSEFALTSGRFPINDPNHARAALSGSSRALHAGNITESQKQTIDAKAHAMIGRLKKT
jgi:hypothetical protein